MDNTNILMELNKVYSDAVKNVRIKAAADDYAKKLLENFKKICNAKPESLLVSGPYFCIPFNNNNINFVEGTVDLSLSNLRAEKGINNFLSPDTIEADDPTTKLSLVFIEELKKMGFTVSVSIPNEDHKTVFYPWFKIEEAP